MNAVTVRGLSSEAWKGLQEAASRKGMSLNKVIVSLLEDALGPAPAGKRRFHDLDPLAGSWSKAEARRFEAAVARVVDPEMWK